MTPNLKENKKTEFRVYLNPHEAAQVEKEINQGTATTPSEVIRRIVEKHYRNKEEEK